VGLPQPGRSGGSIEDLYRPAGDRKCNGQAHLVRPSIGIGWSGTGEQLGSTCLPHSPVSLSGSTGIAIRAPISRVRPYPVAAANHFTFSLPFALSFSLYFIPTINLARTSSTALAILRPHSL